MGVALETSHLRKEYPGTTALHDVSCRFTPGGVHALIGKNGAGKSTLVKILTGALAPSSGGILLDGRPVRFHAPADASRHGIAAVYQELSLVPGLSVAENIALGRWPLSHGLVDWPRLREQAAGVLDALGISIDVRLPVSSLSIAHQQLVEIAKATAAESAILILDEPTSALAHHETELLFAVIRRLAERGVTVLYITHRLQELHRLADTITVLRDGNCVGSIPAGNATPSQFVDMMFGESIAASRTEAMQATGADVIQVKGLGRPPWFHDVSFSMKRGEILGIAGVLGSGRTELLRALFGADRATEGHVLMDGKEFLPRSPDEMVSRGVVLAPENRKDHGLVQMHSVLANICLASLPRLSRRGFVSRRKEEAVAEKQRTGLAIRFSSSSQPVWSLSGGNQQKVVLGKWLTTEPRVLLLDEPTRGIDVVAKQQVFGIIRDCSARGIATLVVSSELEELVDLCHRILVLNRGTMTTELSGASVRLDELLAACMG